MPGRRPPNGVRVFTATIWLAFVVFPLVNAIGKHGPALEHGLVIAGATVFIAGYVLLVLRWRDDSAGVPLAVLVVAAGGVDGADDLPGVGLGVPVHLLRRRRRDGHASTDRLLRGAAVRGDGGRHVRDRWGGRRHGRRIHCELSRHRDADAGDARSARAEHGAERGPGRARPARRRRRSESGSPGTYTTYLVIRCR